MDVTTALNSMKAHMNSWDLYLREDKLHCLQMSLSDFLAQNDLIIKTIKRDFQHNIHCPVAVTHLNGVKRCVDEAKRSLRGSMRVRPLVAEVREVIEALPAILQKYINGFETLFYEPLNQGNPNNENVN